MKLPKLLRGAAASEAQPRRWPVPREDTPGTVVPGARRRRRRTSRPDGPRTIIPVEDAADAETPSWLHTVPSSPMSLDLDAARARLRREIPPVADDGQ